MPGATYPWVGPRTGPWVGTGCKTDSVLDAFDLDPNLVHLNHGSFGAVPRVVTEAQAAVRARAEANPMRFFRVQSPGLKERARHTATQFLGVGADEVALVRNVTQSTAVVMASLAAQSRLGPGDVVVVGAQGYESVRRTVARVCERAGAAYVVVPHPVDVDDIGLVGAFRQTFEEVVAHGRRVALVIIDQITSPTGCRAARGTGLRGRPGGRSAVLRGRGARTGTPGRASRPRWRRLLVRHLAQVGLRRRAAPAPSG